MRTASDTSAGLEQSTGDGGAIVGFKGGQIRRKELATGHDDDIEAWRDVISTKNLSNQSFRAVSNDRTAQPFRRRNAQPADGETIGLREQRVVAAWCAGPVLVDVLKVRMAANPLSRAELQNWLIAADC